MPTGLPHLDLERAERGTCARALSPEDDGDHETYWCYNPRSISACACHETPREVFPVLPIAKYGNNGTLTADDGY